MAGMLPGVEAARRRGFHRSHANNDSASASRRPSFCLYVTNNQEFHFSSRSSLDGSPSWPAVSDDETLDVAVREAKKRLDQRLYCKSGNKRNIKEQETLGSAVERKESEGNSPRNLYKFILKSG